MTNLGNLIMESGLNGSGNSSNGNDTPSKQLPIPGFVNAVHRQFRFETPSPLTIDETMAEPALIFSLPQLILNCIINESEKQLMNCITSLGELRQEYQRPQIRILESNLRLINLSTEAELELHQLYQSHSHYRPSVAKKDLHLQFVPINLHLQRCQVSTDLTDDQLEQAGLARALTIYTVGAFSAHNLGFDNGGGMRSIEDSEAQTPTNNNNRDITQQTLARVWRSMVCFFRIASLTTKIEQRIKQFTMLVERRYSIEENDLSSNTSSQLPSVDHNASANINQLVNEMDLLAKQLVAILNPIEVEHSLSSLESLRAENDVDNKLVRSANRAYERSLSDNSTLMQNSERLQELRRHNSVPTDEPPELEPVDLLHLNIRASLISINTKMNSTRKATPADFEPSRRKLLSAIHSLKRVASLAYAIEAVRLEREQLEQFYTMRLRRAMLFSQALTSIIIGVCGECATNTSFLESVQETGTIVAYFEGLLSCYADEMGMLQDMQFAVEEIAQYVTIELISSPSFLSSDILIPRISGNGYSLRVTIPMASSAAFPANSSVVCSILNLLFNVGINEQATLAETFGQVKMQEEINKRSFLKLENYITNQANVYDSELIDELAALKSELYSSRAKNTRILQIMETISRRLSFIRYTSCKSAKDRTSMAVTLEEARLAFKLNQNLNEINNHQLFQKIIDTLRAEGTRRENTRKNVGQAKYAFNSLQLMTLPKLYRPPAGTYGNVQS